MKTKIILLKCTVALLTVMMMLGVVLTWHDHRILGQITLFIAGISLIFVTVELHSDEERKQQKK